MAQPTGPRNGPDGTTCHAIRFKVTTAGQIPNGAAAAASATKTTAISAADNDPTSRFADSCSTDREARG